MKLATRWGGLAALAGLALSAGIAPAQFVPGGGNNPYARVGGPGMPGLGGVAGGALVANPAAGLNPYLAGGSLVNNAAYPNGPLGSYFANPFYQNIDPYGGYLRGAADVVNAQSNYMRAYQDAKILREQARQAKVDTRRRVFDQWLYERERTPTPEQLRKEAMIEATKRAVNSPPQGEVASGRSLNDLLVALDGLQVDPKSVPEIPLDDNLLKRINVTGGNGNANVGLLRNEGKLTWPRALASLPGTEELRNQLDQQAKHAYSQAESGVAQAEILDSMADASRKLDKMLTAVVRDTEFGEYSDAKRFLRQLDDAITALRNPNAGKVLTGAEGARGRNVSELVRNMLGGGYRFAPAGRGDEGAYEALRSKMANFYNSLKPS